MSELLTKKVISERFLEVVDELIKMGAVKNMSEFAESIEVPSQVISQIKSGKRYASAEMIINTAFVYDLNFKNLLWGEEDISKAKKLNASLKELHNPQSEFNKEKRSREDYLELTEEQTQVLVDWAQLLPYLYDQGVDMKSLMTGSDCENWIGFKNRL